MKYIWKRCAGACSVFIFFAHASPNRMYTRIVIFVTKQNVMAMSIFTRRFMCKNYDARIRNLITTVACAVVVKISKNLVNLFFSLSQIFHFKRWNISFFPVTLSRKLPRDAARRISLRQKKQRNFSQKFPREGHQLKF